MNRILGINISHNVSFALFEDGVLKEFYEEDRFNKIKNYQPQENEQAIYDYEYQVLKKFKDITFDVIVFASFDRSHLQIEMPIINHVLKQVKYKKYFFDIKNHHIYHALCGYYFCNFDEAIALVSDGGGETEINLDFKVLQSIFLINKKEIVNKYKFVSNKCTDYFKNFVPVQIETKRNNVDFTLSNQTKAGFTYRNYVELSGFEGYADGQLMGIAAYKDKGTDLDKNVLEIANKAQEETFQDVVELLERSKQYSNCKNIILSGGYHLNCSNNFKLVKKYPEYTFFVDPIPYDAGTAVGGVVYYENYL
jgi:predicted NodU family carbamoyl transferase|tara:strand:+ start:1486 stop:2409 length:924 start_codon:yes stop_codon:yes gene_type:complete